MVASHVDVRPRSEGRHLGAGDRRRVIAYGRVRAGQQDATAGTQAVSKLPERRVALRPAAPRCCPDHSASVTWLADA